MLYQIMWRVVMILCSALLLLTLLIKSRPGKDIPARAAFHFLSSNKTLVKVEGDVLHPGIYDIPANSLANSVIYMAQPSRQIEQTDIATATTLLQNGSAVTVVIQLNGLQQLKTHRMTVAECMILKIPLDINTMNESDFDRLPGIGPSLAKRIIEYRHNNGGILSARDLVNVSGIGEKKYKALSGYFQEAVNKE